MQSHGSLLSGEWLKSPAVWLLYTGISSLPNAHPGIQAVSLQVTVSHPPGGRLPLLSARPAVTFSAAEHHHSLTGTMLYCLVTEAHRCEQLAHSCYTAFAPSRIWTHDMLIAGPTLYPLRHCTTYLPTFVSMTFSCTHGLTDSPTFCSSLMFWKRTRGKSGTGFLCAGCPYCHPTEVSKALKENPKHWLQPLAWPQSFSSLTKGVLMEGRRSLCVGSLIWEVSIKYYH